MLKLVFVACLAGQPGTCEEREIPIYENVSPIACMMGAAPTLAQWRATHPDWRVNRWRCENDAHVRASRPS